MKKLALTILAAASVAILAFAQPQTANAQDDGSCVRKEFKTELVKNACKKGGQKEAKKAMKKFLSQAKKADVGVKTCKSCHSKLKPSYELTKEGLELFKKAGGK